MATPSTDAPVSPFRQRMQRDMLIGGLGSHTRQDYVRHIRVSPRFIGRSPDTATPEDIVLRALKDVNARDSEY